MGASGREGRRKAFFLEKKKQKTFATFLLQLPDMPGTARMNRSVAVLFFKKEPLSFSFNP
jgi:hypothetical protein